MSRFQTALIVCVANLVITPAVLSQNQSPAGAQPAVAAQHALAALPVAESHPPCSSQIANSDCDLTINRYFPITYSAIQMKRGSTLYVKLDHGFPFEKVGFVLTGVTQSTPADQSQALASSVFPSLKGVNIGSWQSIAMHLYGVDDTLDLVGVPLTPEPADPVKTFVQNLRALNKQLFQLYAQVGEVNSAVSPECQDETKAAQCLRDRNIPNVDSAPRPWLQSDFPEWRHLIMCEVSGAHCNALVSKPDFTKLLSTVNADLTTLNASCLDKQYSAAGTPASTGSVSTLDTSVKCPSQKLFTDDKDFNLLQAFQAELTSVAKDLTSVLQNLETYQGPQQTAELEWAVTRHGDDPYSVPQPVYALTVLNEVAGSNLSTAATPKTMTTISVYFYEPRFEVSTGALFSTVPNRTFANQTKITQVAGVPVPGDVYIAKTLTRPAILPFVAANFRIGHDVRWLGGRRQAVYGSGLLAFNPYTSLLDYGVGVSYSWRSIMFTPMYHLAHDTKLTQGEYTGEVFCNQTAAHDAIPKCSGNPPAPSTMKYLTSAFAIGISIRPQSLFASSK